MKTSPIEILESLYQERYAKAEVLFFCGSMSKAKGTNQSDLDIVVVFDKIDHAYREAFLYQNWPIDAFIHDPETLQYFYQKVDKVSAMCALPQMVVDGIEIPLSTSFSKALKEQAQIVIDEGPEALSKEESERLRFFITDLLDDIIAPYNRAEQTASLSRLYEMLAEFYFRSQNKWRATGKNIVRYLESDNTQLAKMYVEAFDDAFEHRQIEKLNKLVEKILKPYGGILFDGFRQNAPSDWRTIKKIKSK